MLGWCLTFQVDQAGPLGLPVTKCWVKSMLAIVLGFLRVEEREIIYGVNCKP